MLAAALIAFGMAVSAQPVASADPNVVDQPAPPDPAAAGPLNPVPDPELPAPDAAPADEGTASSDACKQFSIALNYAASHYEDFAYNTAGNGNSVNYGDPIVSESNQDGRTALRAAASTAMSASRTPGLAPEISDPMRAWSLRATKLVLVMGLHGGGDTLNSTATDLNANAHDVQMACAAAGTPA